MSNEYNPPSGSDKCPVCQVHKCSVKLLSVTTTVQAGCTRSGQNRGSPGQVCRLLYRTTRGYSRRFGPHLFCYHRPKKWTIGNVSMFSVYQIVWHPTRCNQHSSHCQLFTVHHTLPYSDGTLYITFCHNGTEHYSALNIKKKSLADYTSQNSI